MVNIEPGDQSFAKRARDRQASLTKPPGSLGRLEELAVRLAAIQRTDDPTTHGRAIVIFAGDHGVAGEGVSRYPSEVTGQMLANFASGGAAINAIAGVAGADVIVVDVGTLEPGTARDDVDDDVAFHARSVRRGTRNMVHEPAMTKAELDAALEVGRLEAKLLENTSLVGLGEMGIGNTTAASAMTAALTGLPVARVTGPGTGLDPGGVRHKIEVIERALARHDTSEPLRALQSVGGLEIAALVGFCLQAAERRMAILVDGFITTAAFAVAWRLCPEMIDYAFFAHRSAEPGHAALLEMMDVEPMFDFSLRLGEGTGAALAVPILDAAVAAHNEMATFENAGVSGKTS